MKGGGGRAGEMGVPWPSKGVTGPKHTSGQGHTIPGIQCNRPGVYSMSPASNVVRRVPSSLATPQSGQSYSTQ